MVGKLLCAAELIRVYIGRCSNYLRLDIFVRSMPGHEQ